MDKQNNGNQGNSNAERKEEKRSERKSLRDTVPTKTRDISKNTRDKI